MAGRTRRAAVDLWPADIQILNLVCQLLNLVQLYSYCLIIDLLMRDPADRRRFRRLPARSRAHQQPDDVGCWQSWCAAGNRTDDVDADWREIGKTPFRPDCKNAIRHSVRRAAALAAACHRCADCATSSIPWQSVDLGSTSFPMLRALASKPRPSPQQLPQSRE
eukprot:SAG31_NODE_3601_length_4085_cov_1.880582_6_plen_164_part_00